MTEINQEFIDAQKTIAADLRKVVTAAREAGTPSFVHNDNTFGPVTIDVERSFADEDELTWGMNEHGTQLFYNNDGNVMMQKFFDAIGDLPKTSTPNSADFKFFDSIGPLTSRTNKEGPVLGQ